MGYETESIEFKSQFTEEIYKEIIAFANTDGGVIYVGIDDEGNVTGLTDVDKEFTRITNGIRDSILPDVTMFVRFTLQDNKVVRINVSEGSNKPYFLSKKGLKPGGVFVRQGTSSAPASLEMIRRMIKESDGDIWENERSLVQSLTFDYLSGLFSDRELDFNSNKYRILGMLSVDNKVFSNMAWVVSDQCVHSIKIAVFDDEAKTHFRDSKEFTGSVFKQAEDAFEYLMLCNRTTSEIKGLGRKDKKDYPEDAIREALLNAVVHRDYGFSGSIIINITDKDMEFISIGGLLPGLFPEDIKNGISQPRNKNLAELFHRLGFIESYGTGIRKIYNLYAGLSIKPVIEVTPNSFKIILPNMNAKHSEAYPNSTGITEQMNKILRFIDENGNITEFDIQTILNVKETRAFVIAKQMRDMGLLKVEGRGKNKIYKKVS